MMALPAAIRPSQATTAALLESTVPERLRAALSGASEVIAYQITQEVRRLYGPRLGRYWNTHVQVSAPERLAGVVVETDEPKVLYYEFGTRAHPIAAHQPPAALHFQWHGQEAFYRSVQHPGTPPHNRRDELVAALDTLARSGWGEAISGVLASRVVVRMG